MKAADRASRIGAGKDSFRLGKLEKILPREFVIAADAYLHYSNLILRDTGRIESALCMVLVRLLAGISLMCGRFDPHVPSKLMCRREIVADANSFDGVIERYCGVPP